MNLKFITRLSALLSASFLVLVTQCSAGQNLEEMRARMQNMPNKGKITGTIIDAQSRQPVEYATVAFYRRDTLLVGGTTTNSKGEFSFDLKFYGKFKVKADFMGYDTYTTIVEISEAAPDNKMSVISLQAKAKEIGEVEITGEKSQVQLSLDKKVYNVEKDLTTAGGTAAEVLQNVPSVTVDNDGAVSLRGNSNVKILVDGKPSGLTGISRANILEMIPASTIESIEVITNPSAKYESEGMAGIINIVLKKQKEKGLNGLISLNAGTGNKYSGSLNLNYNTGKVNFFGGYDGRYNEMTMTSKTHRETYYLDSTSYLDQQQVRERTHLSHNFRLGSDFNLNEKNSMTLSGLYRIGTQDGNSTVAYNYKSTEKILTSYYERSSENEDDDWSADLNLNYKRTLKNRNHYLTADAIYSTSSEDEFSTIAQQYFTVPNLQPSGMPTLQRNFEDRTQDNLTLQTDYVQPIRENTKIEAGYRANLRTVGADYLFEDFVDSTLAWTNNVNISNNLDYNEQTHAAYGIYTGVFKKFGYSGGLRLEQTYTDITLKTSNESYKNEYLDFFPSLSINRELKKNHKLQVTYSRRVNRPSYRSLNPFTDYTDPLNLRKGNPFLRPEYTDSYEFAHIKYFTKTSLNTTLYYRYTTDVIRRFRVLRPDGVSVLTNENLASAVNYGAEIAFAGQVNKKIRLNSSFNVFRNISDAQNLGEGLKTDTWSWFGRVGGSVSLPWTVEMQLMANYRGPMESPTGRMNEMFFTDVSFKRDVLKKQGTVTLRFSDPFDTQKFSYENSASNYLIKGEFKRESQNIYLGFSYKFNNYKARERERRRMQENNSDDGGMDMF